MHSIPKSHLTGVAWPGFAGPTDVHVLALLHQLEYTQWWPAERLLEMQLLQIQLLAGHVANNVPFYKERLQPIVGLPAGKLTIDTFRQLPVLTRSDAQQFGPQLITQNLPRDHGRMIDVKTSGSSGQPLLAKATGVTGVFFRSLGLRFHFWHRRDFSGTNVAIRTSHGVPNGLRPGSWADCYPSGPTYQFDLALPVSELFRQLMEVEPQYLQTHPSLLRFLVLESLEQGRQPEKLREVRTFGEVLEPEVRSLCHQHWGVPVANNYSCTEAGILGLQCPTSGDLHVQSESVMLEVVDSDNNPCLPGETGRVILTVLHNFAFPMIRYETGDLAEVGNPCSCGRGLPVLKRIAGRVRHMIRLPNGEKVIPAYLTSSIVAVAPIRQYQLTQKSLHQFEAKLVTVRELTTDEEAALSKVFDKSMGHSFNYDFVYVDRIPPLANGKYELYRSNLN